MEHRERSHRLNSKIVISEPQEKDGTENYRRTPETVTMEIHFEPVFFIKDIKQLISVMSKQRSGSDRKYRLT